MLYHRESKKNPEAYIPFENMPILILKLFCHFCPSENFNLTFPTIENPIEHTCTHKPCLLSFQQMYLGTS